MQAVQIECKANQAGNHPGSTPGRMGWIAMLWFGALLGLAFGPVLSDLTRTWFEARSEMSHGFLAPLVAGYIIYLKWATLVSTPAKPSIWGLVLLCWSVAQFCLSLLAHWVFPGQIAVLLSIAGCIIYLRGFETLKQTAFPLFILSMMVPPPAFLYARLTLSLQLLASAIAENLLELAGFSVLREGNILELVGERLSVVEACSGIRSMSTLLFFFCLYAYFFIRHQSLKITLLFATAPVAIFGNSIRIFLTGVVSRYDRNLAHGLLHEASGYAILVMTGAICLWATYQLDHWQTHRSSGQV